MNFLKYLTLLLLLGNTNAGDSAPSNKGRFFYVDFQQIEDGYGLHKVMINVQKRQGASNEYTEYPLMISPMEPSIALIDKMCSDDACKNYKSYSAVDSKNFAPARSAVKNDKWTVNHFDKFKNDLVPLDYSGVLNEDSFTFELANWNRQTTAKKHQFARITKINFVDKGDASPGVQSYYSGILGLLPIKGDSGQINYNFMYQLKKQGLIDNLVVSFYINSDCHKNGDDNKFCSHIKFGSWDRIGVTPGYDMKFIRTVSTSTWDMNIKRMKIGNKLKSWSTGLYTVRLSPELPYVYLPQSLYEWTISTINDEYRDKYQLDPCNKDANKCRFPVGCDIIEQGNMRFWLFLADDVNGNHILEFPQEQFFLSGTLFGDDAKSCYIPIFQNGIQNGSDKNVIYVGSTHMQHNYWIFDQSRTDDPPYNNIIGFAKRNQNDISLQMHYDTTNPLYLPEDQSMDASLIDPTSGVEDQYDKVIRVEKEKKDAEEMERVKKEQEEAARIAQIEKLKEEKLAKEMDDLKKDLEEYQKRQEAAELQRQEDAKKKSEEDERKKEEDRLAELKRLAEEVAELERLKEKNQAAAETARQAEIENEKEIERLQKIEEERKQLMDEMEDEKARLEQQAKFGKEDADKKLAEKDKKRKEIEAQLKAIIDQKEKEKKDQASQDADTLREQDKQIQEAYKALADQIAINDKKRLEDIQNEENRIAREKQTLDALIVKQKEAEKLKKENEEKANLLKEQMRIATELKQQAEERQWQIEEAEKRSEELKQKQRNEMARLEEERKKQEDDLNGDKNVLLIIILLTVAIIAGMIFFVYKRHKNRFKFKKEEIFDEILDRGHLESTEDMPYTSRLNDSFNEDRKDRPSFNNKLTSQIITQNIQ